MTTASKAREQDEKLREDADKVARDLSDLTDQLGELGREKSNHLTEDLVRRFEDQIDELSSRLSDLTKEAKVKAEQVDTHIKANPYLYLIGAAGLGYFLGRTLAVTKQS